MELRWAVIFITAVILLGMVKLFLKMLNEVCETPPTVGRTQVYSNAWFGFCSLALVFSFFYL